LLSDESQITYKDTFINRLIVRCYKSGQHFLKFQFVIRFVDVFNLIISILMILLKTKKPENHTINRFLV